MQIELTLGSRLHLLRRNKGLTLDDLQKATGINRSQLNSYEKDKKSPRAKSVRKLAEFYNVSIDFLYSGKELRYDAHDNTEDSQVREIQSFYGKDLKALCDKIKTLEISAQKDLLETFNVLVDKALEKGRLVKKKSASGDH